MGPMTAAGRFLDVIRARNDPEPGAGEPARITCHLHGSLAWTGKGHASDRAVILGLSGFEPSTVDPDEADAVVAAVNEGKSIAPPDLPVLAFDPETDLEFDYGPPLPGHANGLRFRCLDQYGNTRHEETYYSTGGGFVVTELELAQRDQAVAGQAGDVLDVPFQFASAGELLEIGDAEGKSIAAIVRANELARIDATDLDRRLDGIWDAMNGCIERGLRVEGVLPGGLKVKRRAAQIHRKLQDERGLNITQPHVVNDWISCYAMAVNEENAAGGKVVTSPTNGAAGVVPAVIRYYLDHCIGAEASGVRTFLLTSAAIGGLIKHKASISGAEVGCQGEVGSASAMAAAGLCAVLGGTNAQIENAAEIALEHHLGMTCDPVKGLVQVPCIERNGLGAIKAVAAASLSLRGDGQHFMPLDNCIAAMRDTGRDMDEKYKETSQGGLAVNLPNC